MTGLRIGVAKFIHLLKKSNEDAQQVCDHEDYDITQNR